MITNLVITSNIKSDLVDFLSTRNNLYIIRDNKRYYLKSINDLKSFVTECSFAIRKEDGGSTKALLFVWKTVSLGVPRNYIKFEYEKITDLDDLLMVLNWNFNKEVYVKLEKNQEVIDSFRKKGFKVCQDRGNEVLLCRSKNDKRFIPPFKEEDE